MELSPDRPGGVIAGAETRVIETADTPESSVSPGVSVASVASVTTDGDTEPPRALDVDMIAPWPDSVRQLPSLGSPA